MSVGQKILIKPSLSGMTGGCAGVQHDQKEPRRRSCSRAETPGPTLGCCAKHQRQPRVMPSYERARGFPGGGGKFVRGRQGIVGSAHGSKGSKGRGKCGRIRSYQACFPFGQAFDGNDNQAEYQGEDSETFRGASLEPIAQEIVRTKKTRRGKEQGEAELGTIEAVCRVYGCLQQLRDPKRRWQAHRGE